MKIIKKSTFINANIDHVYKYIGDIEFFYNELLKQNDNKDIKIKLNGNILEIINKETLFTLTIKEPEKQHQFKALFTPVALHIKRFGQGYLTCTLTNYKGGTNMLTQLESEHSPSFVWRIFIKTIVFLLFFKTSSYEKEFVKTIEQSA